MEHQHGLRTSATSAVRPVVVRGQSLAPLPLALVGAAAAVVAVVSATWAATEGAEGRGVALAAGLTGLAVAGAAWSAAAGCRLEVDADEVRDRVAWVVRRRVARREVTAAHVTAGAWRWFVLELADGSTVTLVGAGPQQVPARLLGDPGPADRRVLDLLVDGPAPTDAATGAGAG